MNYSIIEGSPDWADTCREFCRQAYKAAYVRSELGITEELFTEDIFASPRVVQYYKDLCQFKVDHKTWLAVDDERNLIGMVVAQLADDYCEMRAFYVRSDLKGHGIGHDLYQKVLEFAAGKQIQVDVIEYMQETIDMYKHWGFEIEEQKGKLVYPIIEWPEAARQAYQAIYMIKPATPDK